ncbi:vWA domain-containing protein [Allomesorhizobium camelthorni]|uniref:VWA domain-containing protein n=1 Tax=Allomesorhizobium camelthorni TaxID=475069 RepID=A0A6G4WPT1_9HYPH|nr:vWA domain-containing protein [Mesorhizobium camelthorni]NGO56120.1 VWA domain-containing protein [Mesorhizobium camelthorni]
MCRTLRFTIFLLVIVQAVVAFTVGVQAQNTGVIANDPIAFIGHGMLIGRDGKIIKPDIDFIEKTQDIYINALRARLTEEERATFDNQRTALFKDGALDRRNGMLAKSKMIEWLLKRSGDLSDGSLSGKNSLMKQLLDYEDPVLRDKKFTPRPDLGQRIGAAGFSPIVFFSTTNFGAAYIAECQANGVPTPPDIGSSQWTLSSYDGNNKFPQLPPNSTTSPPGNSGELFLPTGAQVYVYKSAAPEGMCIALPRSANPGGGSSNSIYLDGVICLGKTTSKVCFWDNQAPDGPGEPGPGVPFPEGTVTPITQFAGGADLFGGSGGVCTSCHAGENPYIMHPETPLSQDALPSFPTFSTQWYDPLVHPNWPQNAGPISAAPVPGSCGGCHSAGGPGGRFPLLTSTLSGAYCATVLNNAVNRTMPPSSPGSLSGNAAVQSFLALCSQAQRPLARIENTTLNFGDVEIGFTFSKGLVVHNDGDANLTVGVAVQGSPDTSIWTDIGVAANVTIKPGDPPLVLRQEFKPKAPGVASMQLLVTTNDSTLASQAITLTGNGVSPKPLDSVLILDRSGSMADPAGDVNKIEALRSASQLYADLLRFDPITGTGDKLGFVKYNATNSDYMPLGFMDGALRNAIQSNFMSAGAIADPTRIQPSGRTGIGGAMQGGANMLASSGSDRNIAMVLLTDGAENESPFIGDVKDGIMTGNPRVKIFSVGLGFAVEPGKLQSITNVSDGYHQVVDQLTGTTLFDLESFYFKIFTNAAGLNQVVDPTVLVDISTLNPTVIERARIVTSDRSATFVILDEPALRKFYTLEFVSPKGDVIQPGTTIGGVPIQERTNLNHRIFRIVFPDPSQASEYAGDWMLQLKPNGRWSPDSVKRALADSHTHFTGNLTPYTGFVPIGFMAAVTTDYWLDVAVSATTYLPGDEVKINARLSDRGWPAPDGKIKVVVTLADGSQQNLDLRDDGLDGDTTAADATWSGWFADTGKAGNYKFLFKAIGRNMRGELVPREDSRFVTLKPIERTPRDPDGGPCVDACLKCERCRRQ